MAAGLVVVAAVAVVSWRDATVARSSLHEARTALRDGEAALGDQQDAAAAEAAFARAAGAATRASTHLDGPVWGVVGWLPRVGGSVDLARAAATLADASAALGTAVASHAEELLDESAFDGLVSDGRIDLARLDGLAAVLDGLPVPPVERARDRLADVPAGSVLASLLDDRVDALAQVDVLLERLGRARTGFTALRSFLGADGPRTYLVAAQNPAELRGTGGLIGFLTELTLTDGRFGLGAGRSIDVEDDLLRRNGVETFTTLPDPVDRPAAFADRYDHIAGGQLFASVNADPDLPTVGPVLAALYADKIGPDVDGIIVVDPIALGHIVSTTGAPLDLPDELDTASLPHQILGSELARLVMVDGYDAFGGGGPDKKAFDEAVITAGFERLTAGGWDGLAMARTLGDLVATRHVQLWSADPDEQAAFELLDMAGQVTPSTGLADLLAVTGNNAAGDKSDVHVAHRISGSFRLGAIRDSAPGSAQRRGTLTVEVDNPLRPGDHDSYITGSTDPLQIGGQRSPRVVDALNRTWFSVWTLPTTEAPQVREHGEPELFRATNIHGHRVFDYFLETPSASTNAFEIDLEGRVQLGRDDDAMVYELVLWRQATATPDHWDLTFSPPPGWHVETADVEGGGEPVGMGVGGTDGAPIEAAVVDGSVRLVGAVTRDATLRVRLVRN